MDKPHILIPIPVQDTERRRYTMGKNYVNSLVACGAVPILLPTVLDQRTWRAMYEAADGVLLSGGGDVDPARYGEPRHETTDDVDPERDAVEIALTQWALQDDKPLFAICRGIQVLNVALGGSLIQDLPSQWGNAVHHNGNYDGLKRHEVAHEVRVEPNTRIAQIIGSGGVGVNSFHHQALKHIAAGLVVTSRADDGIVESVEVPDRRYFVGVQWHPEEMAFGREDMMHLFRSFVVACAPRAS